ncbi:polyamine ABC transporter ATP-binding protein [Marinomonas sp. CT5]|uniref:ABC transporter ATP-binding protein n=1 Tax=Marinomonas sp. CT5 TaxID=2066133 RepID=UPI00181D7E62|nr:ABC transporter ATP-binding protein [Marinomonas sp. CT5]NVK74946.1 ABC transporter ATP-binding protein [Oceanospirillaceae bacterium]QUX96055.1 polyamine ABC transporter ATP-binding protein [Marinomonas sp. CT5]
MNTSVEFINVRRQFGDVTAVNDVSIKINEGEFFSMLGPSGSGKTTCLRLIAGFEQANSGSILIHGQDATKQPPYQRDVNTVFQDYALFPHMNIHDNVAYGLMVKGVSRSERNSRALEALKMVALDDYGDRKPSQLSGGQRQRVALARALVNRPRVLLLDEPLGALDQKLREQMQSELKSLQRKLGITFIFVTHDQSEALSMSDRVAVFNNGKIEQVDSARALYNQPKTRFVAEFVGTSNVISGSFAHSLIGQNRTFSIRPEHIMLNEKSDEKLITTEGTISEILYHGANTRFDIKLKSGETISSQRPNNALSESLVSGSTVSVSWPESSMIMLHEEA